MLFSLQTMHVIWFYYICKTAIKAFNEGEFVDERSEPDEFEPERDELVEKYKTK